MRDVLLFHELLLLLLDLLLDSEGLRTRQSVDVRLVLLLLSF